SHTLFFFSSRRRHTRFSRDWSSDVCSSDLGPKQKTRLILARFLWLKAQPLHSVLKRVKPWRHIVANQHQNAVLLVLANTVQYSAGAVCIQPGKGFVQKQ